MLNYCKLKLKWHKEHYTNVNKRKNRSGIMWMNLEALRDKDGTSREDAPCRGWRVPNVCY